MNNRRNFLKIAGAGITGSLVNPFASQAARLTTGNNQIKIGVLLPQSNEHPLLSRSFLNGVRLGLNQRDTLKKKKVEIITEQVNYGSPVITKSKLQQLITENNVNLVVGLINPEVAIDISDLVKNAQLPTIISNAGENYLNKEIKENPFLFFNTLNLLENSFQAGQYAVEKFGKNIGVVTAFYDCGYDALAAFYKGVETAGGKIVETYLKKQSDNDFIQNTLDKLKKANLDGIYVLMNGNLADDFLRSKYQRNLTVPTIASSFAVEDSRLINLGSAASEILNFNTWNKNIDNRENQIFISSYKKQYTADPDQFGYLGYETGLLIYQSLISCNGDFTGSTLANSIASCSFQSPGGKISVNKKSGLISNAIYLCKVQSSLFNLHENRVIKSYKPINEFSEVFASLDSQQHSGWLNPYLFV